MQNNVLVFDQNHPWKWDVPDMISSQQKKPLLDLKTQEHTMKE